MVDPVIYTRLADYCAAQERCEDDVRQKMRKLKIESADWPTCIEKLKSYNFINEERFTKAYVEAYSRKKWGKLKIKNGLRLKHINPALIDKYLAQIEDHNYTDQINTLITRKWKTIKAETTREKKVKLMRFLLGKGFEMNRITAAIKKLEL